MAEWYHVKGIRMWADRGLAWAIPENADVSRRGCSKIWWLGQLHRQRTVRFARAEDDLRDFIDSLGSSNIVLVPAASAVASQWSLKTHGGRDVNENRCKTSCLVGSGRVKGQEVVRISQGEVFCTVRNGKLGKAQPCGS